MEQNKSILIVDDEIPIQRSLKRSFFGLPYKISTTSSAKEALMFLQSNEVNMVISDFKMPIMDGVEFLTIVQEKYPAVIRIMISGFIDKNKLMDCLFRFTTVSLLPKPWDEELLHSKIEYYFSIFDSIGDREVWKRINSRNLISYRTDQCMEDVSLSDYLKCEPSLLCGLLHVYNSDYYNGENTIDIEGIIKHFSKDSLLKLFDKMMNPEKSNTLPSYVPYNIRDFTILYEEKSHEEEAPIIPPFLFNIYSYIYRIAFAHENVEKLQFITLDSGKIEFTKIAFDMFSMAIIYLKYWNTAKPLEQFAVKIFPKIKTEGFSGLDREDQLLFLCDYSLKKNDREIFNVM